MHWFAVFVNCTKIILFFEVEQESGMLWKPILQSMVWFTKNLNQKQP